MQISRARAEGEVSLLELTFLQTFVAIYRSQSVTRAARVVGMTQPAVSQHLKALEAATRQPLFTRTARGVVATPAGHDLAARITPLIDALDVERARIAARETLDGTLHLGGPIDLVPQLVVRALVQHPATSALRMTFAFGTHAELVARVQASELDMMISTQAVPTALHQAPLAAYDEVLVVGRERWSTLQGCDEEAVLAALARGPFVAFEPAMPNIRDLFLRLSQETALPGPTIVVPSYVGMARAAAAGSFVTVVPAVIAEPFLQGGELHAVTRLRRGGTSLVCHKGHAQSPLFRAVLDALSYAI